MVLKHIWVPSLNGPILGPTDLTFPQERGKCARGHLWMGVAMADNCEKEKSPYLAQSMVIFYSKLWVYWVSFAGCYLAMMSLTSCFGMFSTDCSLNFHPQLWKWSWTVFNICRCLLTLLTLPINDFAREWCSPSCSNGFPSDAPDAFRARVLLRTRGECPQKEARSYQDWTDGLKPLVI